METIKKMPDRTVQNSTEVSGHTSFILLFKYLLSTYYIQGIILESVILQWKKLENFGAHWAYILLTENRHKTSN